MGEVRTDKVYFDQAGELSLELKQVQLLLCKRVISQNTRGINKLIGVILMTNENQTQEIVKDNLETRICKAISKGIDTPYNWSLIIATLVLWTISGAIVYSTNQNFDMVTSVSNYIQFSSLAAILYGLLKRNSEGAFMTRQLLRMGIATYILSLLTMIMMKNFGIIFTIGLWVVKPICIFSFLLLIKTMWQIPSIK